MEDYQYTYNQKLWKFVRNLDSSKNWSTDLKPKDVKVPALFPCSTGNLYKNTENQILKTEQSLHINVWFAISKEL